MPLYSMQCDQCGYRFEELAAIGKDRQIRCPRCGGAASRLYQGSCAFGKVGSKAGRSGHVCSGSCACCSGCRS